MRVGYYNDIHDVQCDGIAADSSSSSHVELFTPIPQEVGEDGAAGDKEDGKDRKGRNRERGVIYITGAEKELLEWALGGFLPTGPSGLKPREG